LIIKNGNPVNDETTAAENKKFIFQYSAIQLTATSEQVILKNSYNQIIDAVCWANPDIPASEQEEITQLFNENQWDTNNISIINI